ncbi:TIR domain-containing protein [Tahibacter sp. UC22_41]|uniref:toll/interleukin-1 receptor domain-containing protein n=1 Tax=Tahibacter sp. UC22_41 TaxID=3350178 RepID=UPI0036D90107
MAAKVFISYSRADEAFKDRLLDHLALLKNERLIEPWHDRQLLAGEDYTAKIDREIAKADIVLLLISPNFLASSFCYSRELPQAMRRYEKRLTRVVPIIVRHCGWDSESFARFTALPQDGKAIASWSDQDDAFENVVQGIRKVAKILRVARERRTRLMRYAIAAGTTVVCLAALAYWLSSHRQTTPEPAPPRAALITEAAPNSPQKSGSRRSKTPAASTEPERPAGDADTPADPAAPIRDRQPADAPARASASPDAGPTDTIFASEGVIVITEISATAAPGQAWESGNELAQLPDVLLCFRQTENGQEVCRPNWFGLASARTRAHDDASHAVDLFADMKHWNETFWLALRDQDGMGRKFMGQGECHFGRPCTIAWAGDERTPIAEVLVVPMLQSSQALHTRYLRRCVDGSGVLARQWEALVGFANPGGIAQPDASRISYEALVRTFIAAADIELTGGMLKAALDAGNGQGRLAQVADTFRATLLLAEANAGGQSPGVTKAAVDRRSALLRQRLADLGLKQLIAAGCD